MRFALVNPNWNFDGSIYFGCRDAHLPLEFGYSAALLQSAGHEATIIDGQLDNLSLSQIDEKINQFQPDFTVVTSAPSYLFWRCAPPELACPQILINHIRPHAGKIVLVGPHASTTPRAALDKTGADFVILGECEEVLVQLVTQPLDSLQSVGYYNGENFVCGGVKHAANMQALPALRWSSDDLRKHRHHHHRFDIKPDGWGAEMETSRGCPYACSFCAKENFRNKYRKRPLAIILEELDALIAAGARYVYFIDEIFLPNRELLEAIRERDIKFGVQTRIDLWDNSMLDLLGEAGCVSIEAGVESITEEGRAELNKNCKVSTDDMTNRLIHARKSVAFVQGNLIKAGTDEDEAVEAWRQRLQDAGVWANKPVPLFPYPGSPDYTRRWGMPDDLAWERAHVEYLKEFDAFSDVQDARPLELNQLERPAPARRREVRHQDNSFRILMTCDAVGGVWTYAIDLCRALDGYAQILLAVRGPQMSDGQQAELNSLSHVRAEHHPGALEWMEEPWQDVRAAGEWLLTLQHEFRPDVVHLNSYTHAALPWTVPVVVTAHSCVFSWFDAVRQQPPPATFNQYYRNVKAGLQAADIVVAPTQFMLRQLREHYNLDGDLRVIYNGRNLPATSPGPRAHFIFSAGRLWDDAKNFQLLDQVAPDLHADVLVAGSNSMGGAQEFSNLKLLGQISPAGMSRYFTTAAVYVSPARYEPFGLCNLEAALHGCPLVLSDLDSFREIWQDNAVYINPDRPADLRDAVNSLLDDGILRQRYGLRACTRARHFTADRMADQYMKIYRELAPHASRTPAAGLMRAPQFGRSIAPPGNSASPSTPGLTASRRS